MQTHQQHAPNATTSNSARRIVGLVPVAMMLVVSLLGGCDDDTAEPESADAVEPELRDGDCGPTRQLLERRADLILCGEGVSTPLAMTAASPWGTSAEELLQYAAGVRHAVLDWNDFDDTEVVVEIQPLGTAELIEYGGVCPDRHRVGVEVSVSTADGLLDETYESHLVKTEDGTLHLEGWLDAGTVEGKLEEQLDFGNQCVLDHQVFVVFDDDDPNPDGKLRGLWLNSSTRDPDQLGENAHQIEPVGALAPS